MNKLVWSGLYVLLLLSGCGGSGTPTRNNDFVPLTSIEIVADSPAIQASKTIAVNTSTRLSVIGHYSGLFTRDITAQATWKSSDITKVVVNTPIPGRVKGLSTGTATLTASVGSVSSPYTLTVSSTALAALTIKPVDPSIAKGLNVQFTVEGDFFDKSKQDLTFDADWLSSVPAVATVSNVAANKGLAHAVNVGATDVSTTFGTTLGDTKSVSTHLIVTKAIAKIIVVTPANSSVAGFSKTVNYSASGTFTDGTVVDITSTAVWASSKPDIATIAADGKATTIAAGTTTISASQDGVSGITNLTVTVLPLKANGLKITPVNPTLPIGTNISLTVTATFTDNTTLVVTDTSEWTSNFPLIASVSNVAPNKGLVTGVAAGSATITASYGGQSTTTFVTIP